MSSQFENSLSLLIQNWLEWDQDPSTRSEIEQLKDSNAVDELDQRLRKRIQFGTAGLRGRMAAGFSCMNCLTVVQASQGLAKYIRSSHPDIASDGVVIGHDARYNSAKFARLAANAFIAQDIPVWYYSSPSITPTVAFGVIRLRAAAGIMITASHNPSQDNGYKVYFKNGAQINAPMDAEIAQSIEANLAPWPNAWRDSHDAGYLHTDAYQQILHPYKEAVVRYAKSTVTKWSLPRPFVYTPLHGVGGLVFPDLCHSAGINNVVSTPDQIEPNPDFPTVPFPNPEETGALDIAMQTADKEGINLVIAHDPDADRFSVAEKVDGSWFTFTGNHVGVLIASHLFDSLDSGMLEKMAAAENIYFQETLTGFKWMANIARDLEGSGYTVAFAFEEALGYMFPDVCYDKDGVTAAMVFLAADAKWRAQGLTPFTKLQSLFTEFGHHETLNTYFRSPDPNITKALFDGIRCGSFRKERSLGKFVILRWRDMTEGYDSGTEDGRPALPADANSQMLTLWLDHDVRFTLRASGTEPKVKIYIESCGSSRGQAISAVRETLHTVLSDWIRAFTPSMTYSKQLMTSSGHAFRAE